MQEKEIYLNFPFSILFTSRQFNHYYDDDNDDD